MAFSFVSISIAALAGVPANDAGLASGLINTSQQIGGALGIAVLSSVAIAQTNDAAGAGDAVPQALTSGFQAAFWVGAGIAAAGVLASLVLIRNEDGGRTVLRDGGRAAPRGGLGRSYGPWPGACEVRSRGAAQAAPLVVLGIASPRPRVYCRARGRRGKGMTCPIATPPPAICAASRRAPSRRPQQQLPRA